MGMFTKGNQLSGEVTSVAVKLLESSISDQGFNKFLTEINLLSFQRYKPNLPNLFL